MRLEVVRSDFPKGSVICWFDQTDTALAKKVLGDKFAIQGNIPSSLMVTGTPADVKACCRRLMKLAERAADISWLPAA
jgi:uroporphyrinogen-III decarboxylase